MMSTIHTEFDNEVSIALDSPESPPVNSVRLTLSYQIVDQSSDPISTDLVGLAETLRDYTRGILSDSSIEITGITRPGIATETTV